MEWAKENCIKRNILKMHFNVINAHKTVFIVTNLKLISMQDPNRWSLMRCCCCYRHCCSYFHYQSSRPIRNRAEWNALPSRCRGNQMAAHRQNRILRKWTISISATRALSRTQSATRSATTAIGEMNVEMGNNRKNDRMFHAIAMRWVKEKFACDV